jgi:cytochrome c biogenesis protein CcdA
MEEQGMIRGSSLSALCILLFSIIGCSSEVTQQDERPVAQVVSGLNTTCTGASLSASPPSPQNAGTSVTLNAGSTACSSPLYQYWMLPPAGSWTVLKPWTTSTSFAWSTSGLSDGGYQLEVWVKDTSSSTTSYDAAAVLGFTIGAAGAPCATAALSSPQSSPQTAGTPVTLNASSTACSKPLYQYWMLSPGGSYTLLQPWTTSTSFAWNTNTLSSGSYELEIWAKDASSSTTSYDTDAVLDFTIGAAGTPCATATLFSTPSSPQTAGTPVTLNASSAACSSPLYQYWMLSPGGSYTLLQPWTTSTSFAWNTSTLSNGAYQLQVSVKDASSSTTSYDTAAVLGFTIGAAGTPCAAATLSSTPASPQAAGTPVTLNAGSTACSSPLYQYWVLPPSGSWTVLKPWTASASYAWNTSMLSDGGYQLEVWVKGASSSTTSYDTAAVLGFTIGAAGTPCATATLSSPQSSPQTAGTPVTLNASSTSCGHPLYAYWVLSPGGTYTLLQSWTTSTSFAWNTSGLSNGAYQLEIWAKDASSSTTSYDTDAVLDFAIGPGGGDGGADGGRGDGGAGDAGRGDAGTGDGGTGDGGTGDSGTGDAGRSDAGNGDSGASDAGTSDGGFDSGATVMLSIDLGKGPPRQFQPPSAPTPISPYVYGINQGAAWESTTKWGLLRWGGNAFTSWNWTSNYGNSGSDFCFWQGNEGGGSGLAGAVTASTFPSVPTDVSAGIASLVTVPILGHVSSSAVTNNVWSGSNPPCPGSPTCSSGSANGYAANVGNLDFVSTDSSSSAFVANKAAKGSTLCTCAGNGCGSCAVNTTGTVYEDEFVNYLKATYGSGAGPIFFSLDNEPNYWPSTHPELWPYTGTPGCGTDGTVMFDDIVSLNTTFATAIKAAWPTTKVFGPVVAQDGVIYAHAYNDPNLPTPFSDYYLGKMAAASVSAGKTLLDVFDVHYFTSRGSTSQCMQVPRMFWDPNFTDFSASTTDSIDFGWSGLNGYFDTQLYPRQMIPRILGKIATAYSGKATPAPGLSFSEYNAGCETVIQGGVAEADLLGVFGREGVYAATAFPLSGTTTNGQLTNYLVAAYDLYRNYDGSGSTVGDTAVYAQTSDVEDTSVYAFVHSNQVAGAEIVAINKAASSLAVTIHIASAPMLTAVTVYHLVTGKAGVVAVSAAPAMTCASGACNVTYTLPPTSATTLVLR